MNFKEIVDLALNSIDETDYDEQVEIIVKNAINKAYADLCLKDKRLTRAFIPIINGIATLPEDFLELQKCTPELTYEDNKIGNNIITNKTGVLEIIYCYVRDALVEDDDEPDLHINLQHALATWACYKYFEYRKKVEVANSFLNNYNIEVFNFENLVNNGSGLGNGSISVIKFIDMME